MSLEAQIQNLESLDINPDEIENKKYSEAFRLYFLLLNYRMKRSKTLILRTRSFEMKITYSKANKSNRKLMVPKGMMTSLLKLREKN